MTNCTTAERSNISSAAIPLVSVVIPSYRRGHYIEETLASVFAQTFRDYEIIVVNDGSPDDTAVRLQPLVASGKIRYHEQPNAGQAAARNKGLMLARGEFIAFLDDDDLWPEDKLEWQVANLRRHPHAVAVYGFAQMAGNGQNFRHPASAGPSGRVKDLLLSNCFISSPGQVLARANDLRLIGGFDEKIRGSEDWDLWIRLSDQGAFEYEERCALNYRYHESNSSKNGPYMFKAQMQVMRKHLGWTPLSSRWRHWLRCRRYIGRFCASPQMMRASETQKAGRRFETFRHLAHAVRYDPPLLGSRRVWGLLTK